MDAQYKQNFESKISEIRLPVERPTGVTWAAVLVVLSSLMGLFVRLSVIPPDTESLLRIVLYLISFVVAWGLWGLRRWAYWLLLTAVIVGMSQNLWRLLVMPETFGLVYPMLRLTVLGFWGWYFWRLHVREAFEIKVSKLLPGK